MEEFLAQTAKRHGVPVARAGDGWNLELPIRGGFACSLSIGPEALEWAATIRQAETGNEVFKDWNDYMGYDKSPISDLVDEKQNDISWFVDSWLAATDIKISVDKRFFGIFQSRRAQWLHGGEWHGVILSEPESERD